MNALWFKDWLLLRRATVGQSIKVPFGKAEDLDMYLLLHDYDLIHNKQISLYVTFRISSSILYELSFNVSSLNKTWLSFADCQSMSRKGIWLPEDVIDSWFGYYMIILYCSARLMIFPSSFMQIVKSSEDRVEPYASFHFEVLFIALLCITVGETSIDYHSY